MSGIKNNTGNEWEDIIQGSLYTNGILFYMYTFYMDIDNIDIKFWKD